VIGAGAFASGLIGGREEPSSGGAASTSQAQGGPVAPGTVTFSVLNGTSVDGLAKQAADELESAGYRRGNVTNATEQKAESVVLYARGAEREATAVARTLGISQTEAADSASQALAGDASVIVVVGADQTQ
jgi:LytR cell envelope-related transcriptional attenuator